MRSLKLLTPVFLEDISEPFTTPLKFLESSVTSTLTTQDTVFSSPRKHLDDLWLRKDYVDSKSPKNPVCYFGCTDQEADCETGYGQVHKIQSGMVIPNLMHVLLDNSSTIANRFSSKAGFSSAMADWGRYFGFNETLRGFVIDPDHPHFSVFRKNPQVFSDNSFTPILLSNDANDMCFTHWVMGRLNDLYQLRALLPLIDKPLLLFTYKPTKWQLESLSFYFDVSNCKYLVIDSPTIFSNLVILQGVPNHWLYGSFFSYLYDQGLKSNELRLKNSVAEKKVFVSRDDANGRRILNQSELNIVLATYGFEKYEMSKIPFADQISLIQSADSVIFVTGSSGMNLLHAKSATRIGIISCDSNSQNDPWFRVCRNFGLPLVQHLKADPINPGNPNSDITLDPSAVAHFINEMVY